MRVTSCVFIGLLAAATSIQAIAPQDVAAPAATPLVFVGAKIIVSRSRQSNLNPTL